jgi:MFS family permease
MRSETEVTSSSPRFFYGWWIVAAAFINLFFSTGIIFYGFPVFYPALVSSLRFSRAQVTQGFFIGFMFVGIPFGWIVGAMIDRIGTRRVILPGAALIGVSFLLLGKITRLWQYEILCIALVLGYTLAGPIANQILVTQWFRERRGFAMGVAYLGLGVGGLVAPWSANLLIQTYGWRNAFELNGVLTLLILLPIGLWVTRSSPADMGLLPDGNQYPSTTQRAVTAPFGVAAAVKTRNFWLILLGSAAVMGAINTVNQHFIFFLTDQGYSRTRAAHLLSGLLFSSLAGRVLVGYIADHFKKRNIMAVFYLVIGLSIPLLYLAHRPILVVSFAALFGFAMGADYMLIPLVTAECFGIGSLGKLLALIIMGYSVGQWVYPWMAGKLFDAYHSYDLVWKIAALSAVLGAVAIARIASATPGSGSGMP